MYSSGGTFFWLAHAGTLIVIDTWAEKKKVDTYSFGVNLWKAFALGGLLDKPSDEIVSMYKPAEKKLGVNIVRRGLCYRRELR